jgi:hypothetical protein
LVRISVGQFSFFFWRIVNFGSLCFFVKIGLVIYLFLNLELEKIDIQVSIFWNIYYNLIIKVLGFHSFENSWFWKSILTNVVVNFFIKNHKNKELKNKILPSRLFHKMTLLGLCLGPFFHPLTFFQTLSSSL